MRLLAVFAVLAALQLSAGAQERALSVDAGTSEVRMKLNTTHEVVNGVFHVQSGSIRFDPTTSRISGTIIIAAGSGNTGDSARDRKMDHSILKVDQFPAISFAPTAYSGTLRLVGDSQIEVRGVFTLLGTPHELTVPMEVHMEGAKAAAKGHFVVPYVQWGLKNPSFLFWKAEDSVAIDLSLVGQLSS